MGNAVIKIRFLGGTTLLAAVEELERLKKLTDCSFEFDFNGVNLFYYGQSYAEVDKEYMKALGK